MGVWAWARRTRFTGRLDQTQGLGLDAASGAALPIGAGLVGQEKAREAAGIVVELIKYVELLVGVKGLA